MMVKHKQKLKQPKGYKNASIRQSVQNNATKRFRLSRSCSLKDLLVFKQRVRWLLMVCIARKKDENEQQIRQN